MTVIFYDNVGMTYKRFENVIQVNSGEMRIKGSVGRCWIVMTAGFVEPRAENLPKRRFSIERIEE